MARPLRIEYPGAFYHVINRGNVGRDVAIYLSRELSRESGVELGKYFGNIYGSAITARYNHILEQIGRNRRLKGRANRVRAIIVNN